MSEERSCERSHFSISTCVLLRAAPGRRRRSQVVERGGRARRRRAWPRRRIAFRATGGLLAMAGRFEESGRRARPRGCSCAESSGRPIAAPSSQQVDGEALRLRGASRRGGGACSGADREPYDAIGETGFTRPSSPVAGEHGPLTRAATRRRAIWLEEPAARARGRFCLAGILRMAQASALADRGRLRGRPSASRKRPSRSTGK